MTTEPAEPEAPPAWLAPLLGEDDLVVSPAPISTARHAAADIAGAEGQPCRPGGPGAVHFAVVDRHDPNRVLSFHALTPPAHSSSAPQWWSFVGDQWVDDAEQFHAERGPLRWIPDPEVQLVVEQLLVAHGMKSVQDPPATDALHMRLERALAQQTTGHLDIGPAYLQWAGCPQGLLLEVGDAIDDGPLAAAWAKDLGWLGWHAPDAQNQNAWFQAESPKAVDDAVDLIVRTREVIVNAVAAEREESIEMLTAEDLGRAPAESTEPGRIELVARNLAELLEILGCDSMEALEERLYDEYDDPDALLDLDGGEVFVVARLRLGVGVRFPITASEFWALLDEHYAEVDADI